MTETIKESVHELYSNYLKKGENKELALYLWDAIPPKTLDAIKIFKEKRKLYGKTPDTIEELKKVMKNQLKKLGILTSKVTEKIECLEHGVIETGQQPMCLGGPSLIVNKVVYTNSLSTIGKTEYVPFLYIADYDGVQSELINIRIPSPSHRGLLITYPIKPQSEGIPIYKIANPPEEWLKHTIERIIGNYRGLLKKVEPRIKEKSLQGLAHALTILKNAYYSSDNVSDWATKTLGSLINIEADLGIPIYPFSMPFSRHLFQTGYELLLREPDRSKFIKVSNITVNKIESTGFKPQIGLRKKDYVPFFLECSNKNCLSYRIELKYIGNVNSHKASIKGKCPKCNEAYEFSFNSKQPDLSEIVNQITPRVDSRQIIVDSIIPVICHVGGPGETSYYAEVIPTIRALKIPYPLFIRYTRTFYNTPWNEEYAKELQKEGLPTLTNKKLYSALSMWIEARNEGNAEMLSKAHMDMREAIEISYKKLLDCLNNLQQEIEDVKQKLRDNDDKASLVKELKIKQTSSQKIERYLSSAYGRFSAERYGQEVSWSWIDLAAVTGVDDLTGVFERQYNENTPNSSMFFVNIQ